ncbi:mMS19 nucleotide excision repair protein-like [Silurus meridionalis]|nr:mMS19 nucleotide excision repair protein-like [Silurus meridionalis]
MAADGASLVSLLEEFVSGQADSSATTIATGVKTGQFSILQLVEALGCQDRTVLNPSAGRGTRCSTNSHIPSPNLVKRSGMRLVLKSTRYLTEQEISGIVPIVRSGFTRNCDFQSRFAVTGKKVTRKKRDRKKGNQGGKEEIERKERRN